MLSNFYSQYFAVKVGGQGKNPNSEDSRASDWQFLPFFLKDVINF